MFRVRAEVVVVAVLRVPEMVMAVHVLANEPVRMVRVLLGRMVVPVVVLSQIVPRLGSHRFLLGFRCWPRSPVHPLHRQDVTLRVGSNPAGFSAVGLGRLAASSTQGVEP